MSKIFGTRLKELRKEKGYSQIDIANFFNVSKVTISSWELDKQEPCIEDIKKLATIFQVSTDYLLGYESFDGTKQSYNEEFEYKNIIYKKTKTN